MTTFILALAVRLAYVLDIRGTPITDLLLIDSDTYDRFARMILAGRFHGEEIYSMNLLYPYFLAAVYALLGAAPWHALVVQAVLSALNAALIFALGRRFFDEPTAWVAGLVATVYAPYVFYAGALLTPTLIDLCMLVALLALAAWMSCRRAAWLLSSGIAAGLAALGRGSGILFVVLVVPAFRAATGSWRAATRAWAIFALGVLGIAGAVTVRNAMVEGELVPIAANYAAFYLGHHEGANGLYAMHGFQNNGAGFEDEVTGVRRELSRQAGHPLTQAVASSELFRRGLWWARTHPREEIVLAAKKTYYFWNRTESPTNLGIDFAREFSKVLRALPIHFGIVAPLGLAGILFTRRRWRELMPLYAAIAVPWLTCVLFFMSAEYRLPAAAILILFGGHALTRAATAEFTRRRTPVPRRRREGAIALALLLLFALGCNLRSPLLVAQTKNRVAFYDFGVLFERGGDLGRAEAMLRRSLAIDPRFPPALVALAGIEARRGQAAEASQHLQTARSVDPASAPVATDDQPRVEAEGLYQSAQFEAARAAFERAMVHYRRLGRADDARAMQNNLALTLHRLGRDPDAERILRGLVVEAPDYPKAHSNLALVLESQGRITDAIGEYRRTLELEPTNVRAQRALARLAVH